MFKRSKHYNVSIFLINQEDYELPKRTLWANGYIYRIFKQNDFRYVQNFHQDKAIIDKTPNKFKLLTSTC